MACHFQYRYSQLYRTLCDLETSDDLTAFTTVYRIDSVIHTFCRPWHFGWYWGPEVCDIAKFLLGGIELEHDHNPDV